MNGNGFNRVFISGGTGSVGRALVRAFAEQRYRVTFQYHANERAAFDLARDTSATPLKLDFLDKGMVLPKQSFDILINNAGINDVFGNVDKIPLDGWERTLRINLTVPFLLCREYLPSMINNNWGRIINISSIYGLRAAATYSPYVASKHGLTGLTKTIAYEFARNGITCNAICPGPVDSDMVRRIANKRAPELGISLEAYLASVSTELPIGRMATPQDVSTAALFLASRDASYLNGVSLPVDGGAITV